MKYKNKLLQNSLSGIICQIVTIIFTFIVRNLFIRYIGVELLGINSTFASVLEALSLSELGFQSAIIFRLYKPLHDGDKDSINAYMNILRIVYQGIGVIFIIATFISLPFLHTILSGIEISAEIYLYFILQSLASLCTYFSAYKRAILYADQQDYISKASDMFCNICFGVLQCVALTILRNYVVYLVLKIIQVYIANLIIISFCKKKYPYLHKSCIDNTKFRKVLGDVKNIFISKVAGYIYRSTDNIVISVCISTVSVGYLTNYTTITKHIRTLLTSALNPIVPAIGNFLVDEKDNEGKEKLFLLYSHIRYLLAYFLIIPIIILIDDFVSIWLGNDMILEHMITILICIDLYIDFVHSSTVDFINSAGLFKEEKYIEILGAIINIMSSVWLVHFIGIEGVLLGTVISQIVFWIGRSGVIYKRCFHAMKRKLCLYWLKNIIYALVFLVSYWICYQIINRINITNQIERFIVCALIIETILLLLAFTVLLVFHEQREVINRGKDYIRNRHI